MYIETKEIGPEGLVVDRRIEAFPLTLGNAETVRIAATQLVGEVLREAGGFSFSGDIDTVATLHCSRCLEPYALPLNLHFDLHYAIGPETALKGEARVDEEEVTVTHFEGERIDLSALVAEQIDLGLPLKPLCRTDCRGLCPRCGTNRNQGTCECREAPDEDPRLRVLKDLLS